MLLNWTLQTAHRLQRSGGGGGRGEKEEGTGARGGGGGGGQKYNYGHLIVDLKSMWPTREAVLLSKGQTHYQRLY